MNDGCDRLYVSSKNDLDKFLFIRAHGRKWEDDTGRSWLETGILKLNMTTNVSGGWKKKPVSLDIMQYQVDDVSA